MTSLSNFTHSSFLIYQELAKLGPPFFSYNNNGILALRSGIKNPYFNFLLIKDENTHFWNKAIHFFDCPFECTFERNNRFFIKICESLGLTFGENTTSMELCLETFHLQPAIDQNISIQHVKNEADIRQWINITALGFRLSKSYIKDFFYPIFKSHNKKFKFSICFFNQVPSTASLFFLDPPYSTIFSLATRPQFRNQGLAHKLLTEEFISIRNKGILNCTVQASSQGNTLYKKLGFQENQELSTYILMPI